MLKNYSARLVLVLVSVPQRSRTNRNHRDKCEEIYYRNWFMWLWKLRSPTICHLQAEEPKKLWNNSVLSNAREPGTLISEGKRRWMSQLNKNVNLPFLCLFSIRVPSGLNDDTHIGEGGSSLPSLLNTILISPGNTLTETPGNNVLPAIWASLRPVKSTHKINHYSTHWCSWVPILWVHNTSISSESYQRPQLPP